MLGDGRCGGLLCRVLQVQRLLLALPRPSRPSLVVESGKSGGRVASVEVRGRAAAAAAAAAEGALLLWAKGRGGVAGVKNKDARAVCQVQTRTQTTEGRTASVAESALLHQQVDLSANHTHTKEQRAPRRR